MPTMADVKVDSGLFTMLKGEPGTRKSTQALSYPKPQYWVSTDRKMKVLRIPMNMWGIKDHEISFDDYIDWDKPKAKLEGFKVNCPYKTIIIDSITSTADNMTGQVKGLKKGKGEGKVIGNINVSGLEEYNAEASAFQELIAILKDIHGYHKCNIILIAHVVGQRQDQEKNKLTHHSRVILTGGDKISGKIASYMEEVYHFNIKPSFDVDMPGNYGLFTTHTGNDYARTGLPLERYIEFNDEPLYDKWIVPAINKLKTQKPVTRIESTPQPTQQPSNPFGVQ